MALLASLPVIAQSSAPTEYQLKAAYIYHFTQFVRWPAAEPSKANSPFVIGVLGEDPFGGILERTVKGKTFNNRPIVVKKVRSAMEAKTDCQAVFVSSSEKGNFPAIFADFDGASILTIGEDDQFLESGGIINFVLDGTKIRFQINEAAANRCGLRISAKLLTLAWHPSR